MSIRDRNGGFTMVEVLVAVTLGLFVMAGMIGIFTGTSRSYREDQKTATVANELALGMAMVSEDIEMAGFWGYALDSTVVRVDSIGGRQHWVSLTPSGSATLSVGVDCGPEPALTPTQIAAGIATNDNLWTFDANMASWRPIFVESNIPDASPATFPCITDAEPGTDVIAIMRVNGGWSRRVDEAGVITGSLTENRVYLRANTAVGALWKYTTGTPNPPVEFFSPVTDYYDWEYRISIYYVRSFSVAAGDGIPTLCRKYLSYGATTPTIDTECLAQGIQDMQVEFGIDSDGIPDSIADKYESDPDATEVGRITGVRLWMLARSVDLATTTGAADTLFGSEAFHSNAKTYTLAGGTAAGGKTVVAADSFFRKLGTTTVLVRNPAHLRIIGN